ncbi:MAG: enoyl-[acyl-carrier-protein] reductase FabK [Chloroflexi bacterium CG23_combo_of_CG06-09_8_20_14_all_45_10]|nr:MAG: enoyl-[acyl-carrier-protein] reductase FabK [Chloroflexi bacterium CG23_combo_of_CG06-09_8_20_14_all_45_10]
MKQTRLCQLLGIEYPIIQAPMAWITCAELAAAVSNAGGLGTLGPEAGAKTQEEAKDLDIVERCLREQIRKVKTLTDKPFAVNFPIGWGKQKIFNERRITVAIEEGMPIAIVSMGSPELFTQKLHDAGIKVIHIVVSVEQARKAEKAGVDAIVCIGYEAGGHIGADELPTFVLVPQVVDAVEIPVIAAGGIADARGLVAALALGAEGIYMGTRFLATYECNAHPTMKQAVIQAGDTSTIAFGRRTGISRCLKNAYTARHMEMEASGATFDELREYERSGDDLGGWRRIPAALVDGNITHGSAACGAIAGMINEIISAGEVIRRMVEGYEAVLAKLR